MKKLLTILLCTMMIVSLIPATECYQTNNAAYADGMFNSGEDLDLYIFNNLSGSGVGIGSTMTDAAVSSSNYYSNSIIHDAKSGNSANSDGAYTIEILDSGSWVVAIKSTDTDGSEVFRVIDPASLTAATSAITVSKDTTDVYKANIVPVILGTETSVKYTQNGKDYSINFKIEAGSCIGYSTNTGLDINNITKNSVRWDSIAKLSIGDNIIIVPCTPSDVASISFSPSEGISGSLLATNSNYGIWKITVTDVPLRTFGGDDGGKIYSDVTISFKDANDTEMFSKPLSCETKYYQIDGVELNSPLISTVCNAQAKTYIANRYVYPRIAEVGSDYATTYLYGFEEEANGAGTATSLKLDSLTMIYCHNSTNDTEVAVSAFDFKTVGDNGISVKCNTSMSDSNCIAYFTIKDGAKECAFFLPLHVNSQISTPTPSYDYDYDYDYTPTYTVPVSGEANTVKVQAEIEDDEVTIKDIPAEDIEKISEGSTVSIDLTGVSEQITEVTIPTTTVENVSDSEADGLEVKMPNDVTTKFDKAALDEIVSQASGKEVTLEVDVVSQNENEFRVELLLTDSEGTKISNFNGGSVKITVPIPETIVDEKLSVLYVNENGVAVKVKGKRNADGTFTINAAHFSMYVVMDLETANNVVNGQIDKLKRTLADIKLKAAAKYNEKKNIVVSSVVKTGKKIISSIIDQGYTVEYKYYVSSKKGSGYKSKAIKASGTPYINTTGKKGNTYYYKVTVIVKDLNGKEIASTDLKQTTYVSKKWKK